MLPHAGRLAGVNGGERSRPSASRRSDSTVSRETIGGWNDNGEWFSCILASHPFADGEAFLFESTGGGGWGDPLERDPTLVLGDVSTNTPRSTTLVRRTA